MSFVTVKLPDVVTFAPLKVIAVVPSDALISLPPTVMSPGKLVLPEASKSVRVLFKVPKGVSRPVVVYCLT